MKRYMKKVIINVDWVPNNFSASPMNENVACVATGRTLEEAEMNIVDALKFHLEGMRLDGETIPAEFPRRLDSCIQTFNKGTVEIHGQLHFT